jgi:hypothetical protein
MNKGSIPESPSGRIAILKLIDIDIRALLNGASRIIKRKSQPSLPAGEVLRSLVNAMLDKRFGFAGYRPKRSPLEERRLE